MAVQDIWKYCTQEQMQEMLSSFRLLDRISVREEKKIACLYAVSNHVEAHYHTATLKKKGGGVRYLLVPDKLLCTIQKNLLRHVLSGLSTSGYATAYKKQISIVDNALPHVGKAQVMKLDIKNFFQNITFPMVYQFAFPGTYFPPAVRMMLSILCCYNDFLPQGAPTSPAVSNLVMKTFDEYMGAWCSERRIEYTRYCDDMTFSGMFDAKELKNKVRCYLQVMGFELNEKKTRLLGTHSRQTVTGIVVNKKPNVGRDYRRKLRMEIYYCQKYGVKEHIRRSGQKLDADRYLQQLLGKVQFVLQVNPELEGFNAMKEQLSKFIQLQSGKTDEQA